MNTHNLDIHSYSFEEVLNLFDLDYDISIESLKRAKKKVHMMHPDKSKLPPNYFLFYKKAFDVILRFYENQHRTSQSVPTETIDYEPPIDTNFDKHTQQHVSSVINKISHHDFQRRFNQLFDENMATRPDTTKNEWFSNTDSTQHIPDDVNINNMGTVFEQIKQTQRGLIKHKGVETLYFNGGNGNRLYDDDDDDTYTTSDPFSKLKFDDIRKVHKDQTVFAVSEKDIQNVPQYRSVNHIMQERGNSAWFH